MTDNKKRKETEKAMKRFFDFQCKARDGRHFSDMLCLRTDRMTKVPKILIWIDVLKEMKFFTEARYAHQRLYEL